MADYIYASCALTAFLCAWMLLQAYSASRYRLLLWGGLCFVGLTLNNILVILDKIYIPDVDLSTLRLLTALFSMLILLYGLIYESN